MGAMSELHAELERAGIRTESGTFCENCDNVHTESRKRGPQQWLCVKFKRIEGQGFVAPKYWAEHEPYMRCSGINGGACPLYKPARNGQQENGL